MFRYAPLWTLLFAVPVAAQHAEPRFHETPVQRAAGGAEVTRSHLEPAAAALDGVHEIEALDAETVGTFTALRRGLDGYRILTPVASVQSAEEVTELVERIEQARHAAGGSHLTVWATGSITLARMQFHGPWGNVQVGGYSDVMSAVEIALPNPADLKLTVDDGQAVGLQMGASRTLLRAVGRSDAGARVAYGRRVPLSERITLAWGLTLRGFKTWQAGPLEVTASEQVRGPEDIHYPGDLQVLHGGGFAVDGSCIVDFGDPFTKARIGVRVQDAIDYVGMRNGTRQPRHARLTVGAHLHPLTAIGDAETEVAVDVEDITSSDPVLQLGVARTTGTHLASVTPALGAVIHDHGPFGQRLPPRITGGAMLQVGVLRMGTACEYTPASHAFLLSARLALAFEGKHGEHGPHGHDPNAPHHK